MFGGCHPELRVAQAVAYVGVGARAEALNELSSAKELLSSLERVQISPNQNNPDTGTDMTLNLSLRRHYSWFPS